MRSLLFLFALLCCARASAGQSELSVHWREVATKKSLRPLPAPVDDSAHLGLRLHMFDGRYQVHSQIDARLAPGELHLKNWIHLELEPGVPKEAIAYMKRRIEMAAREHLDGHLTLLDRNTGEHLEVRSEVGFIDEEPSARDRGALTVRIGARGRINATRLPVRTPLLTIAHELAHRTFLAIDEYKDSTRASPTIDRSYLRATHDESLMLNLTPQRGPKLLPRHGLLAARIATSMTGGHYAVIETSRRSAR